MSDHPGPQNQPAHVAPLPPLAWTPHPERGDDLRGELLAGRFRVRHRIGRGGMAWVYLCDDLLLHAPIALKLLKARDPRAEARFLAEARLLANLRHPRLVQIIALGRTDHGAPFIALEHLPGPSLDDLLRRGPLPWPDALQIALQITDALVALHRAGVLHRDIKPANIVAVESPTGRPSVKLIDLGVAKRLPASPLSLPNAPAPIDLAPIVDHLAAAAPPTDLAAVAAPPPTDRRHIVGTPGYLAPEAGHLPPDPRLDLYALGVTLYQLITGHLPEPGPYQALRTRRPDLPHDLPPGLDVLLQATTAIDPDDRPPTALALLKALEALAQSPAPPADRTLSPARYELLDLLGRGATADVHRAYDRDAARYIALKRLRPDAPADAHHRLRTEARALSAVQHPALPRLYEAHLTATPHAFTTTTPHLVLSLAPGRPATDFCLAGRTLTLADAVAAGRQLADALAALHDRGIFHRDINPGNVLIARAPDLRATLIDLGMAELTPRYYALAEPRYLTPPEHRMSLGTETLRRLDWTAPEVRAGLPYTDRSDIFSLALLLWRLLTDKRPFPGPTHPARPLTDLLPRAPSPLVDALAAALQPDPTHRPDARTFRDALADAAAELDALAHGLAPPAPAPSPAPPLPPDTTTDRSAYARARARRDRLRWRIVHAATALGLAYLAFLFGLHRALDLIDPITVHARTSE